MPGNLIQQQNELRGYTDEALQREASTPTGVVPPFLVLTELNRRQTVRQSYEAQRNKGGGRTTVAQDLTRPETAAAAAAMFQQPAPQPMPKFAMGGLAMAARNMDRMSAVDRLTDRYTAMLDDLPRQRDEARAFALINAGLGIMSGTSPNALENIGKGALPALENYQNSLASIDAGEMDILRGQLGIEQYLSDRDLAEMDRSFRERQEANRVAEAEANRYAPTADMRNVEAYMNATPEERAAWDATGGANVDSDFGEIKQIQTTFAGIFNDSEKRLREERNYDLIGGTPEERAAAEASIKQAAYQDAIERFNALYPQWRDRAQMYVDPTAFGGATPGAVDTSQGLDPLGLGL